MERIIAEKGIRVNEDDGLVPLQLQIQSSDVSSPEKGLKPNAIMLHGKCDDGSSDYDSDEDELGAMI